MGTYQMFIQFKEQIAFPLMAIDLNPDHWHGRVPPVMALFKQSA